MPTLLEMGGVTPPDGLHGHSLLPRLRGEMGRRRDLAVSSPRLATDSEYRVYSSITDGEWTLIDGGRRDSLELYHLPSDPFQAENRVAEQPDIAERLHREYIDYLKHIGTSGQKLALRAAE
jgi:arylsulfatase A-like enzyme